MAVAVAVALARRAQGKRDPGPEERRIEKKNPAPCPALRLPERWAHPPSRAMGRVSPSLGGAPPGAVTAQGGAETVERRRRKGRGHSRCCSSTFERHESCSPGSRRAWLHLMALPVSTSASLIAWWTILCKSTGALTRPNGPLAACGSSATLARATPMSTLLPPCHSPSPSSPPWPAAEKRRLSDVTLYLFRR